jgi:hypothetical protein
MVKYSLFLYNQELRDIKHFAKTVSVSEFIRRAIDELIEREKKKELNVAISQSERNAIYD